MPKELILLALSEPASETLASHLREAGCNCRITESLDDALRVLRELPVFAVIAQACAADPEAHVRKRVLEAQPSCRLLFLSNFNEARRTQHLLQFGADDFIIHSEDLAPFVASAGEPDKGRVVPEQRSTALAGALEVLVSLAESDDTHFAGFSSRVVRLSDAIAVRMDIGKEDREDLRVGVLLRDIGKAGIRQELLAEPEAFSSDEREQMTQHVEWSVRLLEHINFFGKVLPYIRHHHERYDGSGYPDGLKGRQIPLGARIIAVAETFAAMTSDRPHQPPRSLEQATREIMAVAGTQLDSEIVEVLMEVLREGATDIVHRQRVLLVEPDRELRRLLRMRLQKEGYAVLATATVDPSKEPELLADRDLVLADISDSPRVVFELLDRVRTGEHGQCVPFAVLVTEESPPTLMSALEHGVDDIINKNRPLQEIVARVKNILVREAARAGTFGSAAPAGVTGQLKNLGMADIIQMLSIGKKQACVSLSTTAQRGSVWVSEGKVVHAVLGPETGEAAFFELMRWDDAEFLIKHGSVPPEESLDADAIYLLMEHFRRTDECTDEITSAVDATLVAEIGSAADHRA